MGRLPRGCSYIERSAQCMCKKSDQPDTVLLLEIDRFVERRLRMVPLFVGGDVWLVLQAQTNIIKTFEEHGFAEIVHFEMESEALRIADGLFGKIGGELIADVGFCATKEFIHLRIR